MKRRLTQWALVSSAMCLMAFIALLFFDRAFIEFAEPLVLVLPDCDSGRMGGPWEYPTWIGLAFFVGRNLLYADWDHLCCVCGRNRKT